MNEEHTDTAAAQEAPKQGGQSAQEDFNKLVGSAKEATEGFQLHKLFEGRIGNVQFIYYVVGSIVLGLVLGMIPIINLLAGLALAVLGVGIGIRRWHDVGVTGWATLIFFVPVVGLLAVLYLMWKHGEQGANKYGEAPDPKRPLLKAILNS
jgi:uncharacterized membrane protein YhaH (DUF805 family)